MAFDRIEKREVPSHFFSLDVLRGVGALVVVVSHWQHFFFRGTEQNLEQTRQPFYFLLQPFYTQGWQAVDLFFCLSGFIFFWLYADKVEQRRTTFSEFFMLRFSRLYPLHLFTLLIVAALQFFIDWRYNSSVLDTNNDLYHLGLQLFFASNWGFERGPSFNLPIWSVSVEILCYALFFLVCFFKFHRPWHLVLIVCIGYWIQLLGFAFIGRGIISFFIGGLTFHAFNYFMRRGVSPFMLKTWIGTTTLLWLCLPSITQDNMLYNIYKNHFWGDGIILYGRDLGGSSLLLFTSYYYILLVCPFSVITLALWETQRGTLGRRLGFLGNISYSTYLIHFPLQLLFISITLSLSISKSFFYTPFSFLLFFSILIPLSWLSYQYLERPLQSRIRGWARNSSRMAHQNSEKFLLPTNTSGDNRTSP